MGPRALACQGLKLRFSHSLSPWTHQGDKLRLRKHPQVLSILSPSSGHRVPPLAHILISLHFHYACQWLAATLNPGEAFGKLFSPLLDGGRRKRAFFRGPQNPSIRRCGRTNVISWAAWVFERPASWTKQSTGPGRCWDTAEPCWWEERGDPPPQNLDLTTGSPCRRQGTMMEQK